MHQYQWLQILIVGIQTMIALMFSKLLKFLLANAEKAKAMIKNIIDNFERHI